MQYFTGQKQVGKSTAAKYLAAVLPQKSTKGQGFRPNITGDVSKALLNSLLAEQAVPIIFDHSGDGKNKFTNTEAQWH